MKYWQALLIEHRARGRDGLTVPFLIGSQHFLKDHSSIDTIDEMITSMASDPLMQVCLRYCLNLGTMIIEISKPNNAAYCPSLNDQMQIQFSIANFCKADFGSSIYSVIQKLKESFDQTIESGLHSAYFDDETKRTNWTKFSSTDDDGFIRSTFQKYNL